MSINEGLMILAIITVIIAIAFLPRGGEWEDIDDE